MKRFRSATLTYSMLIILSSCSILALTNVSAESLPRVYVDPQFSIVSAPGESVVVEVKVANVSDLYGYDLWVGYNSSMLEMTGTNVTGPGQVVPSSTSQYSFFDVSVPGTVRIAVGFLSVLGAPSFNGTGTLLWITFNGTAEGTSIADVVDDQIALYDPDALPIEIQTPEDGEITVIPEIKLLPRVYVDPQFSIVSAPGESVVVEVKVANVSDLYGYDLWVGYNSSIIEHVDITVDGPGQVAPIDPDRRDITDKSELGMINYSVGFANETPTFGGIGTLAWITFRGTITGDTTLHLDPTWTKLYDYLGDEITSEPPVDGEIKVLPKTGESHTDHINDGTDDFPNDYAPMVIPFNGKNITIAPVITCTTFEDGFWRPNYHPCKLAQTLVVDDNWNDKDANYTYIFEDWTDYDWNDIVVSLYAVNNNLIVDTETCLKSREAAWKNPFGVEITPVDIAVEIQWNSTDYPENHIIRLNAGETVDIELFAESDPCDTAFIRIIQLILPTASFVYSPFEPEEGQTVTFDASNSTANVGTIISYTWNYGDGEFGAGRIANHTYETAGNYVVTLNVTNSVGEWDIESKQIKVKSKPRPVGGHALPVNIHVENPDSLTSKIGLTLSLLGVVAVATFLIRRGKKY